jgi:hypothetical protein
MPFVVSRPGNVYAMRDADGDVLWTPNRAKATQLTADEADALEADLRRYSTDDYQVEGVKDAAP